MSARPGWGILGAGKIARVFAADLIASGGRVAAVGSRNAGRSRELADELGAAHAHGSYQELVEDPTVEVVYVATPQPFHAEQALLAVRAGRAVLVEKAFTHDAPSAERVISEARDRGVLVMEAMWTRFLPTVRHLADTVGSGAIGTPIEVVTQHYQRLDTSPTGRHGNPDLGGGALADLGVYGLSFAHLLLGPGAVGRAVGRSSELGVDLDATVLIDHVGGARSVTHTSMAAPGPNRAAVVGTDGWVDVDPYWFTSVGWTRYDAGRPGRVVERVEPPAGHGRGMAFQAEELERCLGAGLTESPLMPLADTLAVMRWLDDARGGIGAAPA